MSEALIITAVKATNLESKDSNGLSDPYAIIECGKEKFRTKIIYKTLNPEWNESFTATLRQGEKIKVILWDDDRIGGDDFEGQCYIDWWKDKKLIDEGEVTLELPLQKGHGISKKGPVKGTVTINLKAARFAEKVAKRGELRTLFPEMPPEETLLEKVKCSFAHSTNEDDDVKKMATYPGTVFLLSHYFTAYAQTSGEPYKFDFAYEMIKSVDKVKKKDIVVITVSGGSRYIFKDINEPESFMSTVNTLLERSASVDADHSKIKSISEEAVAQEQAPCTIVFKVYVPDHEALGCDFGILVTTNTNASFKSLVEHVLHGLGIMEPAGGFRLYSCPPAFREKNYTYKKFDSTSSVASALKSGSINFGDVLILKKYDKSEKKDKKSIPIPLIGSKSSRGPADVTVYYCPDSVTTQGPVSLTLQPDDALSKVLDTVRDSFNCTIDDGTRIYRVGYSSDTDDNLSFIELSRSESSDQTYMTSGDTLYVKKEPPFKTFKDKFGSYDRIELTTYCLLCHCYSNPIHRVWKDESPLPKIAKGLGLNDEETASINKIAEDHAKFGVDAVLVELEDRMKMTPFNGFYFKDSFENANLYKKWLEEQRNEVFGLMETAVTEDYPFCCELHVKVIKGTGLLAADIGGTSDPYCTGIYKTQRKSTSVVKLTLNPTWNETLTFNVTSFDSSLTFFVYDSDINDDDLLGTASINLREHTYILDGEPHELPPIELDKQGSITVQLTCHFDTSRYFNTVAKCSFDTPASAAQDEKAVVAYMDYYRLLYQVFGEDNNMAYERPWILKEFGTRFCISNAYCSYLKLNSILKKDVEFTPDMSRSINLCVRDLIRTTSTPNTNEESTFLESFRLLLQKTKDRYLIDALNLPAAQASHETASKMLEPLAAAIKEIAESRAAKDALKIDYAEFMKVGIQASVDKLFSSYTAGFDWSDITKVMEYSSLFLEKAYPEKIIPLIELLGRLFSSERATILRGVVDSVEKILSTEIDKYVEKLSASNDPNGKDSTAEMQSIQINVMRTIKSLTKFRSDVKGSTGCDHEVKVDQATGLIILWCRKSEILLRKWVESVVINDKRQKATGSSFNSTSPIDVNESITQTIGQLGSLLVEDSFVWTQAAELLVSTVTYYIQLQSHLAVKYFGSEFSEDRRLDEVCISLANMDKGQLMLGDITDQVDGFIDQWKQVNNVSDEDTRMQITSDTINTAVGDAIAKSKAYLTKPLSLVAERAAISMAVPILKMARSSESGSGSSAAASGSSENSGEPSSNSQSNSYSEQITSKIDDILVSISDRVPQNVFRKTLEAFLTAILEKLVEIASPDYEPESGNNQLGLNDPSLCAVFSGIFDDIVAYFSAGLNKTSIENIQIYKRAKQLLLAYGLTTDELITIVRYTTATPPIELEDKRFEGVSPAMVDGILRVRAKAGDKWAMAYQKEGSGSETSNKGNKAGTLYLMSKNLGFSLTINGKETEPIVVPLKVISGVRKVNVMVFMKGIEVKSSKDDEVYVFSKFVSTTTESVIASIKDQARLVGNTAFPEEQEEKHSEKDKKKGK